LTAACHFGILLSRFLFEKGKIMIWSDLTALQQESILKRSALGDPVDALAAEFGLVSSSLGRKIRLLNSLKNNQRSYARNALTLRIEEPKRVMVIADTHFGAHDPSAIAAAVRVAHEWKPQILFHLGDGIDGSVLSRFTQDPSAPSLQQEREGWFGFSESFDDIAELEKRYLLRGNHCMRFETWLRNYGGPIASLSEMTLDGLYATDALGWEPIVDEIVINPRGDDLYPDPELIIIHGDKTRSYSGGSAKAASESYSGASVIMGHAHRSAMVSRRTSRGIVRSYEVGTLADMEPEYARFPDWSQSVLTGVIAKGGFDFWHHFIDRGKVFTRG
jgi:predicted phosphodiesterase